jgi:hypothetical protein
VRFRCRTPRVTQFRSTRLPPVDLLLASWKSARLVTLRPARFRCRVVRFRSV